MGGTAGAESGKSNPKENVYASFKVTESVDVSVADQDILINGGLALALYVGTAGDITVITPNGDSQLYPSVSAGFQPIACTKILNTGTAAAGIVAGAW